MKTHTFTILDVSPDVYREIRAKLLQHDYRHCVTEDGGEEVIDMTGIAIRELEEP